MRHYANPDFWDAYARLPKHIRDLADRAHALLEADPKHPSVHFKKTGRFWIGTHKEYERLMKSA